MRACIVGHGPSMHTHEYGNEIDVHDKVIRLKKSQHLLKRPKLFGTKTDIVMGSAVLGSSLIGAWSTRYWLFLDTRTAHMSGLELGQIHVKFYPANSCLIDKDLCLKWIEHYRSIRESAVLDPRQTKKIWNVGDQTRTLSDDFGHLHPSAGMFAIIYTMYHLRPKQLDLYGFDNVRTGTFDWSVTRGADWKEYPDHNWKTESKLLQDVAQAYKYTINHDAEVIRCDAM